MSKRLLVGIIAGSVLLALVVGASLTPDERTKLQQFRELEQQ